MDDGTPHDIGEHDPPDREAVLRLEAIRQAVDGAITGRCTISFALASVRAMCTALERESWKGAA